MEAAGDLIAAAAKFPSGMQDGIDHLQGRAASLRLNIHGNAPSVVGDGDGLSWIDGDGNMLAVPGQSFVNGIDHDLIDQMVQTGDGGGADIHAGPFPDLVQNKVLPSRVQLGQHVIQEENRLLTSVPPGQLPLGQL